MCAAGAPPTVDDGNPCTADACSPASGVTHVPLAAGASCSDGDACDGLETCDGAGTCLAGAAPVVDDGNPCTTDACAPATGVTHTPVAAGVSCPDTTVCNGAETCDGAGTCVAGAAPVVDDGNPCTVDSCHPVTGVAHTAVANGTACPGGSACLRSYTCQAGACVGANPVVCTASDLCHDAGVCDPSTGACTNPPRALACAPLDACHLAGSCDPATGACTNPVRPQCQGGLPPDPCWGAAPLDATVVTTLREQVKTLWTGAAPVQTGFNPSVLTEERIAPIHGRVADAAAAPLPGVTVTVAASR